MPVAGWKRLVPRANPFAGAGHYPIDAYSEFMPPPRVGWKPYGGEIDATLFRPDDPFGWYVSEYEEARELQPGLLQVARQVVGRVGHLLQGERNHGVAAYDLKDNPFWPPELARRAGSLPHDRGLVLAPVALARTQDDKGRVRWTLFGSSEQGPARAFWRGFFTAPGEEMDADEGIGFFCRLLKDVYGERVETAEQLHRAGFRILTQGLPPLDFSYGGPYPSWAEPFLVEDGEATKGTKYLLTFRPFVRLPERVRETYLSGRLHLLPSPAGLVFWGVPSALRLREELPLALQIPLLRVVARHRAPSGLRVPQSGFLHEPGPGAATAHPEGVPIRNTFRRTHRWQRVLRDQDELAVLGHEEKLVHVLFSSLPDDVGLYDKPMARNVQLWTEDGWLLLDGPHATPDDLKRAMRTVADGGLFGYRFQYPAMRVGKHEVYWHRTVAAWRSAETGEVALVPGAPAGYLTAYPADRPRPDEPVELWPRFHRRPAALVAVQLYSSSDPHDLRNARNVRKLHDAAELFGGPLPRSFARRLLTVARDETLDGWLDSLPEGEPAAAVRALVEPEPRPLPWRRGSRVPESLTFARTARRSFEVAYWKTIAALAEGTFLNKNNADCVRDEPTQHRLTYHRRQLEELGDYLLAYYGKQIAAAGLAGRALAGEVPFRWRTDFDFSWMGGWLKNREAPAERDLLVVIPGRDRGRAVIMADHYDTAYEADHYEKDKGGTGARVAASGADDNHSATAALMLAAPIFLELSKAGRLGCDVWLVHLTGEEFPADCLGARALTERLVEGTLELHLPGGKKRDLSGVRVKGLYVSDMIAHNNDHERDVFQISPGTGKQSLWLAYQAHVANEIWNASVPVWNRRPGRAGKPRGRRSPHAAAVPEPAPHLALCGQVRPVTDPRSTLYNTDGQIFSDAGVPAVLFMENYDINRSGYHDTRDTMANIDLDYGAALAAVVIESVARAATEEG